MNERLNILVLYYFRDSKNSIAFLKKHIYCLKEYAPQHEYLYHNVLYHSTGLLQDLKFDAIILDVTVLCLRWAKPEFYKQFHSKYTFLAEAATVKIALPQDEYDCHLLLDEWMVSWQVDVVFSVLSSNWDILYPNYSKKGRIELAYTGYIDENLINKRLKSFDDRQIDIGYRARKLPPYFGYIGETKWRIGEIVAHKAKEAGLKVDIAVGEQATLYNTDWYDFIENSKFTLGANSGSSLLDPYGVIQRNIRQYLQNYPTAPYEEIEHLFFPNQDRVYSFTAISPRVLEAAMLESCQILVRGEYSGLIEPWQHYIPIEPDGSDFNEVVAAMSDSPLVTQMIKSCKKRLLSIPELRYTNYSKRILDTIYEVIKNKKNIVGHKTSTQKTQSSILYRFRFMLHYKLLPIFPKFWIFVKSLLLRTIKILNIEKESRKLQAILRKFLSNQKSP